MKKLIKLFWPAVLAAFVLLVDGVGFVFCLFAAVPEEEDDFAGEFVGEAALVEVRFMPDDIGGA